ncbi:hypothetical protein D3C78_1482390 [compost metagenome]
MPKVVTSSKIVISLNKRPRGVVSLPRAGFNWPPMSAPRWLSSRAPTDSYNQNGIASSTPSKKPSTSSLNINPASDSQLTWASISAWRIPGAGNMPRANTTAWCGKPRRCWKQNTGTR